MPKKSIQSGPEVIRDFLASLSQDGSLDKDTVKSIQEVHSSGSFTSVKLQQKLLERRSGDGQA